MTSTVPSQAVLHVTNGDSTATTLRRTALGGDVLPWRDALHEGPVPAMPRGDLLRLRAAFLSGDDGTRRREVLSELERRDRALVEALRGGARVVLWFEHDLYDQLQLVDVLTLAAHAGAAPELIVVDSFPGRPRFRGLGELTAAELETLWPSRTAATRETLQTAAAVWEALRAPEPTELAGWARRGSGDLPFIGRALRRLLEELPDPADGLSGTERRALQAVAGGASTPVAAFLAAQELEEAPFLGDTWFHRALAALGSGPSRLVETATGGELPRGDGELPGSSTLRLTELGRRVLDGGADRVELLGIDRWLGGTHLEPGNVWRWDRAAPALRPPA